MSGPKKWVRHRKTSSRTSLSSNHSASSPMDDAHRAVPPSPPTYLPNEDTATAATAVVDFGSGSTLMTSGGLSTCSLDSGSTGPSQSPSTTPPKKTWEKNYKSFLKRSVKHSNKGSHQIPIKPLPRMHLHSVNHKPSRTQSENATTNLGQQHQPIFSSSQNNNVSLEDLGPSLADGFEDHSRGKRPSSADQQSSHNDHRNRVPVSPSKNKESSSRGSTFFKMRMRSKTKSVDNLDASMRRGMDRKSPTNTPPGSASSTPIPKSSPLLSPGTAGAMALQEGMEKAAMLSELLFPPTLSTSTSLGSHQHHQRQHLSSKQRSGPVAPRSILSQGDLSEDNLDQARHRGYSVSMAPHAHSQTPSQSNNNINDVSAANNKRTIFSRVQSMGSNLIIPEGEPATLCLKQQQQQDQSHDDELRERRKAFTDFHNMGIDSSSAYLGDESSLHRHSMFLSSMAYPAGSAGGKATSQRHTTVGLVGGHSLDLKRGANISPSTSMGSISENKIPSQHAKEAATAGELQPERCLRSLKGPEHWTKGERHAIIPGVLCMCPIQVLNNIMSKEEQVMPSSSAPSLIAKCSQRGYGIGSIISEDEGLDSNGWFFGDHNHQPTPGHPGVDSGGHGCVNGSNALQLSAFGKVLLGKATVAPLGMRSFLNEIYGWCTGVFILRQNYLFEYREGDSLNGLPWGYAHLPLAEAYPHKHFSNALHLDFFERPCTKSGKRSLLLRVESKNERDRWVSMLQSAARMTMHDLYDVDESDGAAEFGHGRYAIVRPAKRRERSSRSRAMSISSETRYPHHKTNSQESFRNVASCDSLGGGGGSNAKLSNTDLEGTAASKEYTCALKIIDKREFWSRVKKGRERADTLVREAAVQTTLAVQAADTPGFLRLRNIFETGEKLVLELELLKGTDLFQHVSSRGVLDETEAAHIMRDLLTCLNVLDQVGIAHRDIKPANLLMCLDNDDNKNYSGPKVKLADYGMASFVGVDNLVRGRCGTPGFVAPEILLTGVNGGYGNKVDMFSAGVTLYVMLAGYEPFYGESDAELIDANREAKVDFPHTDWNKVSIEGRDLIERMLVVDPAKRIGPSEALRHPWITRRATSAYSDDCGSHQAICSTF